MMNGDENNNDGMYSRPFEAFSTLTKPMLAAALSPPCGLYGNHREETGHS